MSPKFDITLSAGEVSNIITKTLAQDEAFLTKQVNPAELKNAALTMGLVATNQGPLPQLQTQNASASRPNPTLTPADAMPVRGGPGVKT